MKTEFIMVALGLALAQGPVTESAKNMRNQIIDFYCGHYKLLEQTDEDGMNPPEVYANIQKTCESLRNLNSKNKII